MSRFNEGTNNQEIGTSQINQSRKQNSDKLGRKRQIKNNLQQSLLLMNMKHNDEEIRTSHINIRSEKSATKQEIKNNLLFTLMNA